MLEEKNMLVFVEAIFTIEQLANLLGNSFKPPAKVKTLLTLVAGKYSETKTAVMAATDKCLAAMVKSGAISAKMFADLMINHVVATHKNHRVKQLILEKAVEPIIKAAAPETLAPIFK